jgi:tetratricopeptide (TPR) repeat protein
MNATEILTLYTADYPNIEQDLASANEYLTDKKYERAGKAFRRIGRRLLQLKFFALSLEAFQQSSLAYKLGGLYRKGLETELTIFEVYKIIGNAVEMASTYEKIASYYKYYLNEQLTAAGYYIKSAKIHEENQNYRSAFKKAYFACECLRETNAITGKRSANALACRMAMQSGYYEKAGEHALRWLDVVPKDYSPDYISICVKGYTSFDRTPRKKDALTFLNEIIQAHYLHERPQYKIFDYLIDAQKLHIFVNQDINEDYHKWLVSETKGEPIKQIRYLIDLKNYAQIVGSETLADEFYIREQDLRKQQAWDENRYLYFILFQLWKITCDYGTSFKKWLITSLFIIIVFGFCYMPFPVHTAGHPILQAIKPSLSQNGHDTWFSPFYYSVVTIATLGYGDILPSDTSGQIFSAFEVLLGYLMFGGLLTVFAKKITR